MLLQCKVLPGTYVQQASGHVVEVCVTVDSTMRDIKEQVEASCGLPCHLQKFIFAAGVLGDDVRVGDVATLKEGSVIHVLEQQQKPQQQAPKAPAGASSSTSTSTSTSSSSSSTSTATTATATSSSSPPAEGLFAGDAPLSQALREVATRLRSGGNAAEAVSAEDKQQLLERAQSLHGELVQLAERCSVLFEQRAGKTVDLDIHVGLQDLQGEGLTQRLGRVSERVYAMGPVQQQQQRQQNLRTFLEWQQLQQPPPQQQQQQQQQQQPMQHPWQFQAGVQAQNPAPGLEDILSGALASFFPGGGAAQH